jgi:hypothetical protein
VPDINLEKVCFVVVKAREFEVEDEEAPEMVDGSDAVDDRFVSVFASGKDDSVRQELREFIGAMNEDEQAELVALTWIGRGDYSEDEWMVAVAEARGRRERATADYLLGIPMLADYLEEALAKFDLSCQGIEMGRL